MTYQQGRMIVDNSASGKIHCWILWSTAREGRKDRSPENVGQVDLGF
jgi:hypothetical protein